MGYSLLLMTVSFISNRNKSRKRKVRLAIIMITALLQDPGERPDNPAARERCAFPIV
jgi:hypothetical protein